eukprot:1185716-Prorocentrum_minimum.AAC.3
MFAACSRGGWRILLRGGSYQPGSLNKPRRLRVRCRASKHDAPYNGSQWVHRGWPLFDFRQPGPITRMGAVSVSTMFINYEELSFFEVAFFEGNPFSASSR